MKERPILFSGQMVLDILGGTKTQTRRVIKLKQNQSILGFYNCHKRPFAILQTRIDDLIHRANNTSLYCPYGQDKDRLWVREAWALDYSALEGRYTATSRPKARPGDKILYRADYCPIDQEGYFWRPSIYMPRFASRILLEITAIRAERLQEITVEDARAEGCRGRPLAGQAASRNDGYACMREFEYLWNRINKKRGYAWESNPWVWVVEFKRI